MSAILQVDDLTKRFEVPHGGTLTAVDGVSLSIERGASVGLVGESGSGKTTTGRCVVGLVPPTSGSIVFDGTRLAGLDSKSLRRLRAKLRIVFQEPLEALNPRMRVLDIVGEPLLLHRPDLGRRERRAKGLELLERVQLSTDLAGRRPRELSGGQQQRVGIARAIATDPDFLVLDEPTSALDVSVRAQVLDLLLNLQRELGLSYLFISHDLSTIQYSCGGVAVMYLGRIVESGVTSEVFAEPHHPYTRALLSSILTPDLDRARAPIVLEGEIPSAIDQPPGCPFAPRCPMAIDACRTAPPPLRTLDGSSRKVACIRAEEVPSVMRAGTPVTSTITSPR